MQTPLDLAYAQLVHLEGSKNVERSLSIVSLPEDGTKEDPHYENEFICGVSADVKEYKEAIRESSSEPLSQESEDDSPIYVNQVPTPEYENVSTWCQKKGKKQNDSKEIP